MEEKTESGANESQKRDRSQERQSSKRQVGIELKKEAREKSTAERAGQDSCNGPFSKPGDFSCVGGCQLCR